MGQRQPTEYHADLARARLSPVGSRRWPMDLVAVCPGSAGPEFSVRDEAHLRPFPRHPRLTSSPAGRAIASHPRMLVPCDAVERPVAEEVQVPRHELAGFLDEDAVVALRKHHDRRIVVPSIAEGLAA